MTANLGPINAKGNFVYMGCLGVCVLAGTWRKMAADRWGYVAPHWWGMEGSDLGEECEDKESFGRKPGMGKKEISRKGSSFWKTEK